MIIKPQKSTVFAWFFFLAWIPALIYLMHRYGPIDFEWVFVIALIIFILAMSFTKAFSTYYLDYEGISQKCFFVTRHFCWRDFKFICKHRIVSSGNGMQCHIRCSTVPLPKEMTVKELEKNLLAAEQDYHHRVAA